MSQDSIEAQPHLSNGAEAKVQSSAHKRNEASPNKLQSAPLIDPDLVVNSNGVISEAALPNRSECGTRQHEKNNEVEREKDEERQGEGQSDREEESDSKNFEQSSKSVRNQEQESGEKSNSDRKGEVATSRKCFNKLCPSKKIFKKIRSRVEENKYRFFCRSCYDNYYNHSYCEFCEQIYSNNGENEDDDNWIGCDSCDRWNHIECEKKFRDRNTNELKDKDFLYECLVCTQKSKTVNQDKPKPHREKEDEKQKPKFEISRDQRVMIFHKKLENFPSLETFLQNYSYRLWMSQNVIREDLESLRSSSSKIYSFEENRSKMKKIKLDRDS